MLASLSLCQKTELDSSGILVAPDARYFPMNNHERVLILLRQIVRTIDLDGRELSRHSGMTTPQLILLQTVEAQGPSPVGSIAKAMNLTQATVTNIIDRLELKTLVVRTRSQSDKRKVLISLTTAGEQALASCPTPLQQQFTLAFNQLQGWEQSQIVATLERVSSLLGGSGLDAAPLLTLGAIDRNE